MAKTSRPSIPYFLLSYLALCCVKCGAFQVTSPNNVKPPQLVEFKEPQTNTKVILVGTMHYNPTSIQMVKTTIQELAEEEKLGSVIIESCDIRWNTTMEILQTPKGKLVESIITSEMKVASEEAIKYGRPCVLGDQRINATGTSLGNAFRQTFVDIVTPFNGGWKNLSSELKSAIDVALPTGEGYLSPRSILDPRLLIAAPVSFAKYPLSFLVRNPVSTSIAFAIIGYLTFLDFNDQSTMTFMDATLAEQISSIALTLALTGLEFIIFGRLLIQVLLAERNEIIASNILEQCKMYSNTNEYSGTIDNSILSNLSNFVFGTKSKQIDILSSEKINGMYEGKYVPDSIQDGFLQNNDDDSEKVVVAVLGMAHCNGVTKLLKEGLVE